MLGNIIPLTPIHFGYPVLQIDSSSRERCDVLGPVVFHEKIDVVTLESFGANAQRNVATQVSWQVNQTPSEIRV